MRQRQQHQHLPLRAIYSFNIALEKMLKQQEKGQRSLPFSP
ncbi:MAG: hypothetical protein AAF827_07140 [Cyanobacteria bacterium P01_D01_bin.6]